MAFMPRAVAGWVLPLPVLPWNTRSCARGMKSNERSSSRVYPSGSFTFEKS